jgi:hypothetical protein
MLALSPASAPGYLASTPYAPYTEITPLSGGVANIVLKCTHPHTRHAIVLKQPLPQFKTHDEWLVDIDRARVEHEAALLLTTLLPPRSIPDVLFFDEANYILALAAAAENAVLWKTALLAGHTSIDAATHAGTLLALLHSHTLDDPALRARYGDPKFFAQQRIDPYLLHTAGKHPALAPTLHKIASQLLSTQRCLIHGDFSPKNIFLVPHTPAPANNPSFELSHLLLLDFEVAFYSHPAFDVATLINHLLLKAFLHFQTRTANPALFLEMITTFWDTYRHTADPDLVRLTSAHGGHVLGALLLARIDGKSPAEYLIPHPTLQSRIRTAASDILSQPDSTLSAALVRFPLFLTP